MTTTSLDRSPFDPSNTIGDPGRQPEIQAASGPLNVGVPDTALDFLTVDSFELRACSTRGWSHRYKGTPRQDSYSLLVNDELIVVAVADGVSEGDFSHVAAETAARSACKIVADQVGRAGAVDWVQLARRISMRIIEESEYRQISAAQGQQGEPASVEDRLQACLDVMSTTLIVALIRRSPTAQGFLADIGVVAGDSAAYLIRDGALVPLSGGKSDTGTITSTRVRPLPGVVEPLVSTVVLAPGQGLILGSDGIGDPLGDGTGEVGQQFGQRWAGPPRLDQFLLDLNVYRRSFDDDRTAVGIWTHPDTPLPPPDPVGDEPAERVDPSESTVGPDREPLPGTAFEPAAFASVDPPAIDSTHIVPEPGSEQDPSPAPAAGDSALDDPAEDGPGPLLSRTEEPQTVAQGRDDQVRPDPLNDEEEEVQP